MPARGGRLGRRDLVVAVSAALVSAAVTVGIVVSLGHPSPRPSQLSGLSAAAALGNPYGPSADWMGMEILSSPTGIFINSMDAGGGAFAAGLEPGDDVVAIDGHTIDRVPQIRTDTNRLRLGTEVQITVIRNSVRVNSQLMPMMERPTIVP